MMLRPPFSLRRYASWYFLFDFFWTTQFLSAFGEITLATAFAVWYFTHDEQKGALARVVSRSLKCVVRHHLGTAAFGSFVIAVVQFVRAVVMYVQHRMTALGKRGGYAEKCTKAVLCCISCCLWCVEKCLKFINRNAYIQTGIFGHSFCRASKEAFHLILRSLARIGARRSRALARARARARARASPPPPPPPVAAEAGPPSPPRALCPARCAGRHLRDRQGVHRAVRDTHISRLPHDVRARRRARGRAM